MTDQRQIAFFAGMEAFCKEAVSADEPVGFKGQQLSSGTTLESGEMPAASKGYDWQGLLQKVWKHIQANPYQYAGAGLGALGGGLAGGLTGDGGLGRMLAGVGSGAALGAGGGELAKAILSRMGSTGEGDKRPRDDKISYPDASKMDVTIPTEE